MSQLLLMQLLIDFSLKKISRCWCCHLTAGSFELSCQLRSPSSPVRSDCSPNHSVAKASGYTSKDTLIEFCPSFFFCDTSVLCNCACSCTWCMHAHSVGCILSHVVNVHSTYRWLYFLVLCINLCRGI